MLSRLNRVHRPLLRFSRCVFSCPIYLRPDVKPLTAYQENVLRKFPWPDPALLKPYYKEGEPSRALEERVWTDFVPRTEVVITGRDVNSYMKTWLVNRECIEDFNTLYREFHQWSAVPDYDGFDHLCEPRLAKHMKKVVRDIHLAGLALELERMTVRQPKMEILEFEIYKGLHVFRHMNGSINDYTVGKDFVYGFGPKCTVYRRKNEKLIDGLDVIERNHKPYLIRVKMLVHSHMKLYGYTKSETQWVASSSPIGKELMQNVVQFEINVKGLDFYRFLPLQNKPPLTREWLITDFNNAVGGNELLKKDV